ncbi:hypothetical protein O3P69_004226 [Scylla paramamosain]|uniref:Uncharacterized protein n=1 Tax=Scylla paramamosain TaxID=85552 RepID=A0AAW0UFM4_SCYPA
MNECGVRRRGLWWCVVVCGGSCWESRDFPAAESEGRTRPGGEGGGSAGGPPLPPSPGAVVRCVLWRRAVVRQLVLVSIYCQTQPLLAWSAVTCPSRAAAAFTSDTLRKSSCSHFGPLSDRAGRLNIWRQGTAGGEENAKRLTEGRGNGSLIPRPRLSHPNPAQPRPARPSSTRHHPRLGFISPTTVHITPFLSLLLIISLFPPLAPSPSSSSSHSSCHHHRRCHRSRPSSRYPCSHRSSPSPLVLRSSSTFPLSSFTWCFFAKPLPRHCPATAPPAPRHSAAVYHFAAVPAASHRTASRTASRRRPVSGRARQCHSAALHCGGRRRGEARGGAGSRGGVAGQRGALTLASPCPPREGDTCRNALSRPQSAHGEDCHAHLAIN